MDDPHKMIAGRQLRGTPHKVEGLLVEAIGLIVNDNCHRPEILPALIAQMESFPCKSERSRGAWWMTSIKEPLIKTKDASFAATETYKESEDSEEW